MSDRIRIDGPLILGAGLAGLSAALAARPRHALVISPSALGQGCASGWAQGGMAAAILANDSAELHAADTESAGAGLVDPGAALALTSVARSTVERLAALGSPFDRDASGALIPGLEAAHSRPRIAHVGGDRAGSAIMSAVAHAVEAAQIDVWCGARALALLQTDEGRVVGAVIQRDQCLIEVLAPAVILATGGLGGLYAVTTNPAELRGEGLAMAALAGAEIFDPEFVQFHPTAMALGMDPAPLATEALRGEGAILINREGRRFMSDVHPDAELAPRDVVARAVHAHALAGGAFLDARAAIGERFPVEFPAVFSAAQAAGLDPRREPIPIAPAAHYHMGGVRADTAGRTSLDGLYAVGECAGTGVHGANRLASNSLLEAAAFGAAAGAAASQESLCGAPARPLQLAPDLSAHALQTLRHAMARHAGVVRDGSGLLSLLDVIGELETREGEALALVSARLVAQSALERRESRGGHFRSDYPETLAEARHTRVRLDDRASLMAAAE